MRMVKVKKKGGGDARFTMIAWHLVFCKTQTAGVI